MSSAPELSLLSYMLREGDFRPLTTGAITEDHFLTDAGKVVHSFIMGYQHMTGGVVKWPSLEVIQERFEHSSIELPALRGEVDPGRLIFEVQDRKTRKELYDLSEFLSLASSDASSSTLAAMQGALDHLKRLQNKTSFSSNQLDMAYAIESVMMDYACGALVPHGLAWPWPSMTLATKGLHRKEFIVMAGRPKSRKTFTALSVCAHAILHSGARVLCISPEMPPRQMLLRLLAFLAGVRYGEFKDGNLNPQELLRFSTLADAVLRHHDQSDEEYAAHMTRAFPNIPVGCVPSFVVIQGTNKPVSWIESQIEIHRPDIVLVDSFYRLSAEGGKKSDTDWKVVSHISRGLKDLAMNTSTCLIGTHQMNRDSENKVGTVGNMALADAVGQDADLILRIVTGKINGEDRSAVYILGGREAAFDGVIINNKPCWDYTEVAPIENIKQVQELLKREDDADGEEALRKTKKAAAAKSKAKDEGSPDSDAAPHTNEEKTPARHKKEDFVSTGALKPRTPVSPPGFPVPGAAAHG